LAVAGLFPLSFSFLFSWKGAKAAAAASANSRGMAEKAGREIAVVRRMRMRGSAMGFGLLLVEKGRLEI